MAKHGAVIDSYCFHLLTLVLGVGHTKPNRRDEEEEEVVEMAVIPWMELLNEENGVLSLKPQAEVDANRDDLGFAWREVLRQAWSKYYPIINIPFLNPILAI